MARRIRLRSRIFAITALFAALLFVITLVLSWRAHSTQQKFSRLLSHENRAVALLEDVIRLQSGFLQQWRASGRQRPEDLLAIATRYRVVAQILEREELRTSDVDRVRSAAASFGSLVRETARTWNSLPDAEQTAALRAIETRSEQIAIEAARLVDERKRELARQVPLLERSGENMRHAGLAVAWIIAVISFAAASTTLASVVRPLEELSEAASRVAGGDLTARAPVKGDLEIAKLAQAFNRMAESLSLSHDALMESARTDELTGLPNFRAFRESIAQEISRAERYGHPLGILVIDLDRFKQFNDAYGHQSGNDALGVVATAIRNAIRSVDSPARYGGEEFSVLLPEVDENSLLIAAERIRVAVEGLAPLPDARPLTVSIGGALHPRDGHSADAIFAIADERLYAAKRSGRNRSVVS